MLLLVLGATIGLLLMHTMYDRFTDLMDVGAGAVDVIFFFAVTLPGYLSVMLPLSVLLSLLYTMGRLHRNLEITAMRAAGVGLFRITRVIWGAGVLLCALTWYLNASLIPWSVEESRAIWQSLQFRSQAQDLQVDRVGATGSVTFDNRRENRMWFMNRFSEYTNRGYGVAVTELDGERQEKTRLQAREAWYDRDLMAWIFKDGRETWVDPATGEVTRTVPFDERLVTHYREDPELMLVFDRKPSDLSFRELRRVMDFHRAEDSPKIKLYAVRYYSLLADTLGPLIIIALAIPFSVSGVRVNPAVGVSKSIGLFFIYFILVKTATALGARGTLDPMWAGIAPSVGMLLLGIGFFSRVR